jgi:GNAT superfamily N-acetyltransferase
MDVATLAELEHENMIEANTLAASQVLGAHVDRSDGIALFATGLPLRLFNQVLIEDDSADAAAVGAAVALLHARRTHFAVNLRRIFDDRHIPTMASLGLVPLSDHPWMPGMAMHPLPVPGSLSPASEHEIRQVTDAAGVADHIHAAAAGFGMPEAWLQAIVTEKLARLPGATLYVGYTDAIPVSTGLGIRTGRTIGVYNIATVESARRRGYGAAMTMRIVDDGAAAGCDVAILQASLMGQPIYERLGFRTVVEYFAYVEPESVAPPDA